MADLITQQQKGADIAARLDKHNRDFTTSYERWFTALYKDKYHYLGEYDLMELAFRLDLSLYYWGVVEPVFNTGEVALLAPPFSPPSGKVFAALISCYSRRFACIARRRRRLGLLGKMNDNRRSLIPGFTLDRSDTTRLFTMLGEWAKLEIKEGWRSWGKEVAATAPARSGNLSGTPPLPEGLDSLGINTLR